MSEIDLPDRLMRYGGYHIEIERVALTFGQALAYKLPSFSAREKAQDARYRWFVKAHGSQCWELDALNPVTLRDVVEGEIRDRIEWDLWTQAETAERAEIESISTILDAWPGISGQASK